MAVLTVETVDRLLSRATRVAADPGVKQGEVVPVATIDKEADLVYGLFGYVRRAIGVPGRLLTTEVTRQPVLAIKEGVNVTPLAYAEDVVTHPLSGALIGQLESLSNKSREL